MIAGIFHKGSGLGNQLHRYVATRVLALDKGYDFSMVAPENFKGKDFMNLDMGLNLGIPFHTEWPSGKVVPYNVPISSSLVKDFWYHKEWEEKTPYYNPEFNFIEDNTIIDGEFQDERYFEHRLGDIKNWLSVVPLHVYDDVCMIGFRGGEFYTVPELGLPKSYFDEAIAMMREVNPKMRFLVNTDDPELAKKFFPDFDILHDVAMNWRNMRYAKHAIIANSSFFIFPRLLNGGLTIAPRYWDRYNIKKWERPYNYYKCFTYL